VAPWRAAAHHHSACSVLALRRTTMDSLIYLVGLIVVIMAVLSFLGLH
jgi:hypothetical protein